MYCMCSNVADMNNINSKKIPNQAFFIGGRIGSDCPVKARRLYSFHRTNNFLIILRMYSTAKRNFVYKQII